MLLKPDTLAVHASCRRLVFFMALAYALAPRASHAIVVLEKGSTQAVMGFLVRETDESVILRQELTDGKTRELTIPKSRIDELLVTVAPERLAALDPAKPALYREYAEELVEKRRDPEARDAARRLFAIAAHRGDANLRHGALLGLISLARTDEEERRLRALAYMRSPSRDEAILSSSGGRPHDSSQDGTTGQLRSALKLIRQGKASAAKTIVEQPLVKQLLSSDSAPISAIDIAGLLASPSLGNQQLAQVLRAELALEALDTRAGEAVSAASQWSLGDPRGLAPLPSLKLDGLSEFDPAECVFRDGRWVRP